jgi:hypothetical protein
MRAKTTTQQLQSDADLLKLLQKTALDVPERLAVVHWIWGVSLPWEPRIDQHPIFMDLDALIRQSNQEFIDDMVRYGRPMRLYAKNLWYRLLEVRETLMRMDRFGQLSYLMDETDDGVAVEMEAA